METKKLSLQEMEMIEGASWQCGLSIVGLVGSIIGTGLSLATLNPVGVSLGIIGIYASGPTMLDACDLI